MGDMKLGPGKKEKKKIKNAMLIQMRKKMEKDKIAKAKQNKDEIQKYESEYNKDL